MTAELGAGGVDATAVSVVPARTADIATAYDHHRRRGAVVLTGDAAATDHEVLLRALFGARLHQVGEAVPVRAAGGRDRPDLDDAGHLSRTPLHTDGFALAEGAPDVLLLACERSSPVGGESFLVDVDQVVAALARHDRELVRFVTEHVLDQTEPGKHVAIGPIGIRRDDATVAWRRSLFVRPVDGDADPARTTALLARWDQVLAALDDGATRFRLDPGDLLLVDNTRVFHGRDAYEDTERLLWRRWAWTDRAVVPDHGYTGSDTSLIQAS